jgi:threonine/homoserine/homoserine lactone efflux protein
MTGLALFAQSLLIGFSIAAPVGPIGLLTIQRSLQFGRRAGLATGLGAAAADALYGAVGAFGVAWLIQTLTALRLPLALLGGAYLLWMAISLVRAPQPNTVAVASRAGAMAGDWRYFSGTFLLTLANPATIFSFIAIFGSMAGATAVVSPWTMVAGVFVGSALWWLLLSALVGWLRERFDVRWRRRISLVSAAVLSGFAVAQLVMALRA